MSELEFIKAARLFQTPYALIALSLILVYLLASPIKRARERRTQVAAPVFTKLWILFLCVIVGGFVVILVPFLLDETRVHGVVLERRTASGIAGAEVSLDGLIGLRADTDRAGNFLILVPARQRQDQYVVRARFQNVTGTDTLADREANQKTTRIELELPEPRNGTGDSVTVTLPDGMTLRRALVALAQTGKASCHFKPSCASGFLATKIQGGEMRARDITELMRQLNYRLISPNAQLHITVTKDAEKGVYEISCTK